MSEQPKARGVRGRLQEALEDSYDKVWSALDEAMSSNRAQWLACPKCNRKSEFQVPDHGARVRAVEIALSEGYGKRASEDSDKRGKQRPEHVTPQTWADVMPMEDDVLDAYIAELIEYREWRDRQPALEEAAT